jgi:hypothetical protein
MNGNVFVSWSGVRAKAMATALHGWLPHVIQSVAPFFSDKDIAAGEFWDDVITEKLKSTVFSIVCVTPENLTAPWLNYEAGALSIRLQGRTAPWLYNMKPESLKVTPLSRLMANMSDPDGTFKIVQSLNEALETQVRSEVLKAAFESNWPKLETALKRIPPAKESAPVREDREVLEELVKNSRRALELLTMPDIKMVDARTATWEIEYRRMMDDIKRRKGLVTMDDAAEVLSTHPDVVSVSTQVASPAPKPLRLKNRKRRRAKR